jgi:hypothetical protein
MTAPNRISVTKHEGKIRMHLELPVGGDDPALIRVHDVDIPVVHDLAIAAGLVNESVAILRFPTSPRQKGAQTPETVKRRLEVRTMLAKLNGDRAGKGLAPIEIADGTELEQVEAILSKGLDELVQANHRDAPPELPASPPPIEDRCEAP